MRLLKEQEAKYLITSLGDAEKAGINSDFLVINFRSQTLYDGLYDAWVVGSDFECMGPTTTKKQIKQFCKELENKLLAHLGKVVK